MINTKLIFVDGISGSGKSTMAHYIARQLKKNNIKVKCLFELEEGHPLQVKSDKEDENEYNEDYILHFLKQLDDLVDKIINDNSIYIIESYFFQNIFLHLLANDCNRKDIDDFYCKYLSKIDKLNPVIIHFFQNNTETALNNIWQSRGFEYQKDAYIKLDGNNNFCKNRNISGESGTIAFWDEIVNISLNLFDTFNCSKIQINNSTLEWDIYRKQITDFLEIDQFEEKLFDESYEEYCGQYGGISVYIKNSRLSTDWFWPDLKLLYQTNDEFEVEGFPVLIKFLRDDKNEVKSLKFIKAFYPEKDGVEWSKKRD